MTFSPPLAPDLLAVAKPPLAAETPADAMAVEALIERAFGPGRLAKTAERLREGNAPYLELSRTCWADGALAGCVRMWPIRIGERPAVFLGPFAVEDAWRSRGLGAGMIRAACRATQDAGHDLILLVGAQSYFGPLGFTQVPPGQIVMPGPVDPRRLLARALKPGAADGLRGLVVIG
jgi:predicted N-acetyltransferase YhbS